MLMSISLPLAGEGNNILNYMKRVSRRQNAAEEASGTQSEDRTEVCLLGNDWLLPDSIWEAMEEIGNLHQDTDSRRFIEWCVLVISRRLVAGGSITLRLRTPATRSYSNIFAD